MDGYWNEGMWNCFILDIIQCRRQHRRENILPYDVRHVEMIPPHVLLCQHGDY